LKKATDNKKNTNKVSKKDFAKKINIIMGSIVGISCVAIVAGILISYYVSTKKTTNIQMPNGSININQPSSVVPVDKSNKEKTPKVNGGEEKVKETTNKK